MNEVIDGKDNEIGRLRLGKEICTTRKRKNILNDQQSETHREKLGNIVELAPEFSDNESITSEGNDVYTQEQARRKLVGGGAALYYDDNSEARRVKKFTLRSI